MKKKGLIILVSILIFVSSVWAGESVTIGMSCTIPAIPGVNSPPFNKEKETNLKVSPPEEGSSATTATEGKEFVKEEKEILLAQEEKPVSLQTIYPR